MNEKSMKWITVLMTCAVVGLLAFQGYWINNVIEVGKKTFKHTAHEALHAVTNELEQQEILYTAEQKLKFNQRGVTVVSHDSVRFISKNANTPPIKDKVFITEETVKKLFFNTDTIDLRDPQFALEFDSEGRLGKLREGQFIDEDVMIEISRSKSQIDTVEIYDQKLQQKIEKVREKSEMVMVVLNELISKERNIQNRISKEQLDTLIARGLKNRGLDTDFAYGVYNDQSKELLLSSTDKYEDQLLKSNYRSKLFKSDVVDQHNYLTLYFPDKGFFIFKKVLISLIASLALILIIVYCYGYAIYIIKKQKQISEIKNDFINNMTHEFKTPISTVSLACEALRDKDVQKNEKFIERYIGIINDENARLGTQVEKVLQMATLDKKDFKLKLERLDIHEIIENAIQNINLQVEKRGGSIHKKLKADRRKVVADELHLTNIIYNLLDNANKYSKENPDITIATYNENGGISVSVADKGIGMSKEVVSKIFDKFYRVPTGNLHDVKGFGLGLAYVKTMLEALGGRIDVKSSMGKGSEFEIYLPQNGKN